MTSEQIHDHGVRRHGAAWINANQRAVDALTGTPIKPWNPGIKDAVAIVLLRVLDGVRLDSGEEWLRDATEWTPRASR